MDSHSSRKNSGVMDTVSQGAKEAGGWQYKLHNVNFDMLNKQA